MVMDNKQNIIYHFDFQCFQGTVKNVPSDMNIILREKNNTQGIWTSLHFQCDTFFIHTLKLLVHILTKTDTTYF